MPILFNSQKWTELEIECNVRSADTLNICYMEGDEQVTVTIDMESTEGEQYVFVDKERAIEIRDLLNHFIQDTRPMENRCN